MTTARSIGVLVTAFFLLLPAETASGQAVGFADLKDAAPLAPADQKAIAAHVLRRVQGGADADATPPAFYTKDNAPRIVIISASDGDSAARVYAGAGRGVAAAVDQAIKLAGNRLRDAEWVRFDIVTNAQKIEHPDPSAPIKIDRSLQGLAIGSGIGLALLPGELLVNDLIDGKERVNWPNVYKYLQSDTCSHRPDVELNALFAADLWIFETVAFFADEEDDEPARLYRGHRSFESFTADDARLAAQLAGHYLTGATKADGTFVYYYRPDSDTSPNSYNMVRHAGSVYAMYELQDAEPDDDLLKAADRALGYLIKQLKPSRIGQTETLALVDNNESSLGGIALTLVALAQHERTTHVRQHLPLMQKLAESIVAAQNDDGRFIVQKQRWPDGTAEPFESEYYPGEAILALARYSALDPSGPWLSAAQRGANYLITVRDRGVPIEQLTHDHWLLYALEELYRRKPDPIYVNHATKIGAAMVQAQNLKPTYPDWLGGWHIPPRAGATATRTEGLLAATRMLTSARRPQDAEMFLEAAKRAVAFQLQSQFRPENAMFFKDPSRALGGFSESLTDLDIRVDGVQHNLSSLLAIEREMRESR